MTPHAHVCRHGPSTEVACCPGECACVCGAVLVHLGYSRWDWQLEDGSRAAFPDPNEAAGTIDRAPVEEVELPAAPAKLVRLPPVPRVRVVHCVHCKLADGPLTITPSGHVYHKACAAKYVREWKARRQSA